jgi:hypothetical protein
MVGFTEICRDDEKLPITYDNIKNIEVEEQAKLYEEAFDKDDFDTLEFSGIVPPTVQDYLESIQAVIAVPAGMVLTHKKLEWMETEIANDLRQEGNFFQPGGHYFAWSDFKVRTRCYIYGPVQDLFEVRWVHWKHGGDERTLDAGESYAGWGRLEYYEGRLWQMGLLDITNPNPAQTDLLTGAKNGVSQQSA